MATSDPYADLPASIRRANLVAHREAVLSDRMAQELHARRLTLFDSPDGPAALERIAKFDELLAEVDEALAALPPDEPADQPADAPAS